MKIQTFALEKNFSRIDFGDEQAVWIGDPCYIVPSWNDDDNLWDALVSKMFRSVTREHPTTGEVYTSSEEPFDSRNTIRAVRISSPLLDKPTDFYMWSTAYGDGCYKLLYKNTQIASLGVDAGCLSIIPMSLIKAWGKESQTNTGTVVTRFSNNAELYVEDGNMFWGPDFVLPTGGSDLEEEEDEWMECDENSYC